ncbi:hypothetical protein Scep_023794 [Stephania cephalantha]|uniref:Uncharacterized protein n=1 Tax=Stephania cephalantha TaxID=152367 RepID=A0AAP0HXR7_9MAGN
MSFAIYDAWCRRASIRYTGNIYLIAKKRIAPIYLTEEVFEHYKRMRATDEAFKKKSEQMSSNRKTEVGGPGTGISLHSAGSISARQHSDTLEKKLQRRPTWKEMFRHLHTHGHDGQSFVDQRSAKIDAELTRRLEEMCPPDPDTSIDEDAFILRWCRGEGTCIRFRVTRLSSQSISLGEQAHLEDLSDGSHELEELRRDHQRLQETFFEGANGKTRTNARETRWNAGEETREMRDQVSTYGGLDESTLALGPTCLRHRGLHHHPGTSVRSSSDDHPGHLTTEITPSRSAHPHDHRLGIGPLHIEGCLEDQRHLLDDHDEFMEQLMRLRDHRHGKSD